MNLFDDWINPFIMVLIAIIIVPIAFFIGLFRLICGDEPYNDN